MSPHSWTATQNVGIHHKTKKKVWKWNKNPPKSFFSHNDWKNLENCTFTELSIRLNGHLLGPKICSKRDSLETHESNGDGSKKNFLRIFSVS